MDRLDVDIGYNFEKLKRVKILLENEFKGKIQRQKKEREKDP